MTILLAERSWSKVFTTVGLFILIFFLLSFNILISWKVNKKITKDLIVPTAKLKEACIIPQTPHTPDCEWKPSFNKYNCSYEKRLTDIANEKDLKLLWDSSKVNSSSCCLQEVTRKHGDRIHVFSKCSPLAHNLRLTHQEAFLIKCGNYLNIEVTIPDLPQVQRKQAHWKQVGEQEHPYNVLLLGIDTVSHAHMHKSAPKAIKLMKEMGFVEFDSFHSVGPSTLSNFNAALMGLTTPEVRRSCAPDWTTPFDKCPFIWNNFSAHKYITGYVEDGFQTFNWGGQSGFVKRPTDYYFPQLFQFLVNFRKRQFNRNKSLAQNFTKECASSETIPEFLWRYVVRFVKKFEKSPHFLFSYNAQPFHEDSSSLPHFAVPFETFLKNLRREKKTMEKTIIIFFTDHGDRRGLVNRDSVSSYYERLHPCLFIRLPENMDPKYHQALLSNSKKFVTPFDIHETLLHILSLKKGEAEKSGKVARNTKDLRSSLLLSLRPDRTCSNTNIPKEQCICNAIYPETARSNNNNNGISDRTDEWKLLLLNFLVQELNYKVKDSAFRDKCQKWSSSVEMIRWLRMINSNGTEHEYVISFGATPKPARFDGRVKVTSRHGEKHTTVAIETFELVSITRANEFGKQSWCVDKLSHEAKEMKEYCYCKSNNEILKIK